MHEIDVIDLVDGTDEGGTESHGRSPNALPCDGLRRTHRKTEGRVFFGDVMAQEREMERLHYERSRQQQSTLAMELRKGEKTNDSFQHHRAEQRRSARQKRRRHLSPRSPIAGRSSLRGTNVSLVTLDEEEEVFACKRRVIREEGAIQDASLHSTAWRNIKLKDAPGNLVPDRQKGLKPFARKMDIALDEFDMTLKKKCLVSMEFLTPKPWTMTLGTVGEARDVMHMDAIVHKVIDEATLLVKKCHAARVKVIIGHTRQQIATYLEDQPVFRAKMLTTIVGKTREADEEVMWCKKVYKLTNVVGVGVMSGLPLRISRLEEVAARRLLRNANFVLVGDNRPHYSVGRNESGYSELMYPTAVTCLSKIAPIPRSTTCMLVCGTHRVEDDPIIRFVPYFSAGRNIKSEGPQVGAMDPCKDTLVGMDDEVKEFVLRYAVGTCGSNQSVFDALQRTGAFTQPFANYSDIIDRVTRELVWKRNLHELDAQYNSGDISAHRKRVLAVILDECRALQAGTHLRDRLKPLPAHVILNYLQHGEELGVRGAALEQYRELAIKYQDFFCRRCCVYSCRNHGRKQPVPAIRVDPCYPVVKTALKLWRRIEESAEDTGVDTDVEEIVEAKDELVPELMATATSSVTTEIQQACDATNTVAGESTRRSLRAQTAASTKASSKLNAVRVHIKKMVRSKTTDASEYLGLDGVYQAITQDKKLEIFSTDVRCGSHCSKPVLETIQREEANNISGTTRDMPWRGSEITLLKKLVKCVGLNPCALAALLTTRSCMDVADFLHQRERLAQGDLDELVLLRSGICRRNRERTIGVLGNSYEHLCRTRSQRMKDRGANHEYLPCNHDGGSCDSAQCFCMRRDHYCEKSCGCSRDCSNRFPGCHCEVGQCQTSKCPCYFAARECDPDACTSCGACELPVVMAAEGSKGKTAAQLKICGNVNILRGNMRKIGISASVTHGWGAYALEDVKTGEFIYEYTGSLLSQDEAERRGNVYDKTTISFLFDLTEDSVVDATRKGNKSKFANHDSTEPKCFARIMLVNGDHRIGIYAKVDVAAGDELFFDYGYSGVIPDWSQARIGSSKEAAPVAEDDGTKANLVDEKEEHKL